MYNFQIIIKSLIYILLIIIHISNYYKNFTYCLKCFQNNKFYKKCYNCPFNIIFKGLKVYSEEETLNEIIINNKSISRFGDGEFGLIFGYDIGFQKYNEKLSKKLLEVLNSNENNLLIGINIKTNLKEIEKMTDNSKKYYFNWIENNKVNIVEILNISKKYYSSYISRFYLEYKNKNKISDYIKILKKIWEKKKYINHRRTKN